MVTDQKIRNFKDLKIWQESISLVEEIYRITKAFPRIENYGIVSQIRRSAVSIPSNIAEGFMKSHNKEFKQFLFIALASSAEVETQLIISNKLKYISNLELGRLLGRTDKFNKMTMSLIKRL